MTILAEIRRLLGLNAYDKLIFRVVENRVELVPISMALEHTFSKIRSRKQPEDFQELHDIAIEEQVARSLY